MEAVVAVGLGLLLAALGMLLGILKTVRFTGTSRIIGLLILARPLLMLLIWWASAIVIFGYGNHRFPQKGPVKTDFVVYVAIAGAIVGLSHYVGSTLVVIRRKRKQQANEDK